MSDDKRAQYLPAVQENGRPKSLAPAGYGYTSYPVPESEPDEPSVPLSHYLFILRRRRWRILSFVFACVVATLIISSRLTPIFESTATVDIDRQAPPGVIGQEALRASANDADQFLATQIKLIQSDAVLRPIAQKYKLLEHERQFENTNLTPAEAEQGPIVLKKLSVFRPPNTYLLLIGYRSPNARLAAEVANGIANSYLEHTYNIRIRSSANLTSFMEKQLDELRAKMEASTQRLLAFERELNVINPEEKTNILSARLLQLNTEWTNAQADRVRKEAAFNSTKSGSLEAAQVSTQGEALKKLGEQYADAQVKFAEAKLHYGPHHPEYKKASSQVSEILLQLDKAKQNIAQRVEIEYRQAVNREAMLQNGVAQTKNEFDRLNARSVEYQTLKREADADKKLYDELVRKIKEAGINASFQNSAIRIADVARPGLKPVFPDIKLNVFLAFLFSSLIAVGAAVLSDALDKTIRDPEQVVRLLNSQVIGSLPTVKTWRGRIGPVANGPESNALVRVGDSAEQSGTGYGEAIRTLRNSILLTDFDRRMRSLLITSASPGEGKSTVAANLAATHAGQKQRTLLIDGDLRRPSVHRRFNLIRAAGLSNVLVTDLPWKQAVIKSGQLPDLDILPAGPPSRRASDLMGRGLIEILDQASSDYDLIVLDAPPMLGFAEPLQMATAVDGVIVVTRAGETNRQAVASVLSTLNRLRVNVLGIVLNEVSKEMSDSYYYYGYYGTYYGEINAGHRM